MKKKVLPMIMMTLCIVIVLMSGCNEGPWDYRDVVWYSEDPKIEITAHGYWFGTIEADSEIIEVHLAWGGSGGFTLYRYIENVEGARPEHILLDGGVRMDGENAVLIIVTDNIYNHKYETITLKQRPMEVA